MQDNTFDQLPESWRLKIAKLRRDSKSLRLRLRAAETRIAELEARSE